MSSLIHRLLLGAKAARELGIGRLVQFGWYRLGLRSGALRRQTPPGNEEVDPGWLASQPFFTPPARQQLETVLGDAGGSRLLQEAEEILDGQVRLFGADPVPLLLSHPETMAHWTAYEKSNVKAPAEDIKFIWEAGRFGWACTLARAYRFTGDERYAAGFWENTRLFLDSNPVNLGPHWSSAQEVALRLMALTFCLHVFWDSVHLGVEGKTRIAGALADHARRISPSLSYARAQGNNHLLTEALGLFTAGAMLPGHPQSAYWRTLGWRWLNKGLQDQIAADGTYMQHSANYHRLMLQTALWGDLTAQSLGMAYPKETMQKLSAATRWLLCLLDEESGQVPNLGPNDGAYILPLTACSFHDYRPVLQTAARVFLGEQPFGPGQWDEMTLWLDRRSKALNGAETGEKRTHCDNPGQTPHILRSGASWAYLRAARFHARPGHADQLHMDLWWRGVNVAQDAGTYLYNAPPPWDNVLAHTAVHNTLTVNGRDQMTWAGRFLFLDWAQATVLPQASGDGRLQLSAQHDGYRRQGVTHRRTVSVNGADDWLVQDDLLPTGRKKAEISTCIHWLLPDWPWEVDNNQQDRLFVLRLQSPFGVVQVTLQCDANEGKEPCHQLVAGLARAGEVIFANSVKYAAPSLLPALGWVSSTYGQKTPALSLFLEARGNLPLRLTTQWVFP